jgi:hypothetical protein
LPVGVLVQVILLGQVQDWQTQAAVVVVETE